MKTETRNYTFYFYVKPFGKRFIIAKKDCKKPNRTKVYKALNNLFDQNKIESFGYCVTTEYNPYF